MTDTTATATTEAPDERAQRVPALIALGSDDTHHSVYVYASDRTLWFLADEIAGTWMQLPLPPSDIQAIAARPDIWHMPLCALCKDNTLYGFDWTSLKWSALPPLP